MAVLSCFALLGIFQSSADFARGEKVQSENRLTAAPRFMLWLVELDKVPQCREI
jgi:hypothetical protein